MDAVRRYDFAVACWCERDDLFLRRLRTYAAEAGVDFLLVEPLWVETVLRLYTERKLAIGVLLDLASDYTDPANAYTRLAALARERQARVINDPAAARRFSHKGEAHVTLQASGLPVPFGLVLPYGDAHQRVLTPDERIGLGQPFFIKPCHGFAGKGVLGDGSEMRDVHRAHAAFADSHYLLQRRVDCAEIRGEPAYWRVIWILGQVHLCWWHPRTREYNLVLQWQIEEYALWPLLEIGQRLAQVTGLDFFSVEAARTREGTHLLVDYVNEQIDLRPKSFFRDGVPDALVERIARYLVQAAEAVRQGADADHGVDVREERLLTVREHYRAGRRPWPPAP